MEQASLGARLKQFLLKVRQNRRKRLWLVVLGVLVALGLLVWWQRPKGELELVFCNVGQGDAILIQKGGQQVLIDGGPPNRRVLACLGRTMPFWDRKIEAVVLTHPERDHYGGLLEVARRYRVGVLFYNGVRQPQELFEHQQSSTILAAGDRFCITSLCFDVLWPNANSKIWRQELGENAASVVLLLHFGEFRALFTGDIPSMIEQILCQKQILPKVGVLKVAHHGSASSTTDCLLQATHPDLAIISVGKNRFGHPAAEVLSRLEKIGARVLTTKEKGEIKIIVKKDYSLLVKTTK